jgi:hypothetical protein
VIVQRWKAAWSVILLASAFFTMSAQAGPDSPVGAWRTIDDKTGKERSVIRISESGGVLEGKVEEIFAQPGDDPKHLCKACEGERKGKPVIGMTILWGLKKEGNGYTAEKSSTPTPVRSTAPRPNCWTGATSWRCAVISACRCSDDRKTWIRQQQ